MGREIKRVPLDFDFPIGESFHDHMYEKNVAAGHDPDSDAWPGCGGPPRGEGWQLWQTVSDGPITPVFKTPEELIEYMCQPAEKDRLAGPWGKGWKREVAEKFVRGPGWAPSFMVVNGEIVDGPEAVTRD